MASSREKSREIRSSNYSRGRNSSAWSSWLTTLKHSAQHFVAGMKRKQQATIFKTGQRPIYWQEARVLRRWKSEEGAVFQWSNNLQTVNKFSFQFPVECCSKHPRTGHDDTSLCDSFFLEMTWFCIHVPLWFCYQVWICCNASPPCEINMKIFFHVWNL